MGKHPVSICFSARRQCRRLAVGMAKDVALQTCVTLLLLVSLPELMVAELEVELPPVKIQGAGASFPNSLYQEALFAYQYIAEHVDVMYASMGSGAGQCRIKDFDTECGASDNRFPEYIDFAGSDSVLVEKDYELYPDLQMLPTVAGAVVPVYNLEGLDSEYEPSLILDRATLAGIFRGAISHWRDQAILRLNPVIRDRIPNKEIMVVVREDSSGTTEIWKKALSSFDPVFKTLVGESLTGGQAGWPTSKIPELYHSIEFRNGNQGVSAYVLATPNSIGYSVLGEAKKLQLQSARILQGENAVEANSKSIMYAMVEKGLSFQPVPWTSQESSAGDADCELPFQGHRYTADLVDTKGILTYPISGYTYLVIRTGCPSDRLRRGATCRNVLETVKYWHWFYSSESVAELASDTGFASLPYVVMDVILERLLQVHCDGVQVIPDGVMTGSSFQQEPQVLGNGTSLVAKLIHTYSVTYQDNGGIQLYYVDSTGGAALDEYHRNVTHLDSMFRVVTQLELREMSNLQDSVILPWLTAPLAIICNLPELKDSQQGILYLDIPAMARLMKGAIVYWNDTDLVRLNPPLEGVNEKVTLVMRKKSQSEAQQLLDGILQHYAFITGFSIKMPEYGAAFHEENTYNKMAALILEKPYTVGIVTNYVIVGIGGFQRAAIYPDGSAVALLPTSENVKGCFKSNDEQRQSIQPQDLFEANLYGLEDCYPLSVPLYVLMQRHVSQADCRDLLKPVAQTVEWWYWMLFAENIDSPMESLGMVHLVQYVEDFVTYTNDTLHSMMCNGEPILKQATAGTYKLPPGVVAGIVVMIVVLVCICGVLVYIYHKKRQVEHEFEEFQAQQLQQQGFEHDSVWKQLDLESPIVKIQNFLQEVADTGRVMDQSKAAELVLLLQTADNLQAPALKNQLRSANLGGNGQNQMAEYLMHITDESNDVVEHSSASETISDASRDRVSQADDLQPSNFEAGHIRGSWFAGGAFPEDLIAMLAPLGEDFFVDVVGLEDLTERRPLSAVTIYLLHKFDIVRKLKLDEDKIEAFIMGIEDNYSEGGVPFHTPLRAADVVCRFGALLKFCSSGKVLTSELSRLAGIIAAAVCDFNHTGYSNAFHVRCQDELAIKYNDQHVLENHSLVHALDLLHSPHISWLHRGRIPADSIRKMRTMIIDMVLATDMFNHFEIMSAFQSKIVSKGLDAISQDSKAEALVAQVFLKVADIGYYALPIRQHLYWTKAHEEECFRQGDLEKNLHLPISPMMDRYRPSVMDPSNQVGFIDILATPMFETFHKVCPGSAPLLNQLQATSRFWRSAQAEGNQALLSASMDDLHRMLTAQCAERYENIVGITVDGKETEVLLIP
mmetsp:Transcript_34593/g.98014  ORF Transcript_34593/g.98014 Transcript_34593/m.98014 type:complete len:1353 (-) Transcript_34593:263-4321(-)|eukprot:CAMPEP_0117657742 /NCGR_PEP_ID=MMETSP0804-20121206/5491_1 /TAXON_ID=1074897 /ORGANISM="Tetraselmis astigmatica, Strain CCMP880" /LENGTH=1352 /DNA_ID=CAMNT_0005464213 /DNA_START=63 /DNA_END=4121 /DNA_ORIENTATION=+